MAKPIPISEPVDHPPAPLWGDFNTAAARIGASKRTIERLVAARKLKAYRLGGRIRRINLLELDALLLNSEVR